MPTIPVTRFALPASCLAALVGLCAVEPAAAVTLIRRLLPVLGFAATMSIVVNIADREGIFEWATTSLAQVASGPRVVLTGFTALCVASTVFLSLDTTAIMLTPLAVHLARRNGWSTRGLALTVVWIANLASLALPVSNLTNLLAADAFISTREFARVALPPAMFTLAVAVAAAAAASFPSARTLRDRGGPAAPPRTAVAILAAAMVALLTPVPYWLTGAAAAASMMLCTSNEKPVPSIRGLVPWQALALTLTMSSAATLAAVLGGADIVAEGLGGQGLVAVAGAGALAANAINNIPAFFIVEPAVATPTGLVALLIGVNAGALITPWASLATLLWADQLRRSGEEVPWRAFVTCGLVLAPLSVLGAVGTLHISA